MQSIEDTAAKVRRFWKLGDGPISNVVWLLENNGAIVSRGELGAEELDGFSCWTEGRPYVFLSADKASAARSRFDAAHELAHLVLHRDVERPRAFHPGEHRQLEVQAHRFAGAFLLPAGAFSEDVFMPTLDAPRSLKSKWMVSIGMMIHRAADLALIDADQVRRLWVAYSRRGWKREEPLDDELPVEEPRLQRDAFELILREGVRSRADVLSALTFSPTDIEELAVLPRGSLSDARTMAPLVQLKGQRSDVTEGSRDAPAQILPFPSGGRR